MLKPQTHAIIVAHANADRFNLSVARQYRANVEALACRTILREPRGRGQQQASSFAPEAMRTMGL